MKKSKKIRFLPLILTVLMMLPCFIQFASAEERTNGEYEITMKVGDEMRLENYASSAGLKFYAYNWFTDDASVAAVSAEEKNDSTNTVTAVSEGTATVTTYLDGTIVSGYSYTSVSYKYVYHITVVGKDEDVPSDPVEENPSGTYDITMKVGDKLALQNYASPIYMVFYAYNWFSDDDSVVSVSAAQKNNSLNEVTAVAPGTATVTTYLDGSFAQENVRVVYNHITKEWDNYTYITYTPVSYKYVYRIIVEGANSGGSPETEAPETDAPETEAPTTQAPTTQAPTTQAPTTQAPTTQAPTTQAPTTQALTTQAPEAQDRTTDAAKDEGGCSSALGVFAALTAVVSVLGVAIVGKKH